MRSVQAILDLWKWTPMTKLCVQGDESVGEELTPVEGDLENRAPMDTNAICSGRGSASPEVAASGPEVSARVAHLLTALVTRRVPSLTPPSRSPSSASTGLAALAPSTSLLPNKPLPPLAGSSLEHLARMTAVSSALSTTALRKMLWLHSHLLPADIAPIVTAAVPAPAAAAEVLASLTEARPPAGLRVHVLVAQLQHAAAEMYDARKAVEQWRASYDTVSHSMLQHLSSCGRGISSSATKSVRSVQLWSDAAMAHSGTLLDDIVAGVLSLEASRAGQAWGPGKRTPCYL
jgi:hypothetical protein